MADKVTPSDFLNFTTSRWGNSLPIKALWTLEFTALERVAKNVNSVLNGYERTNSSTKKFPVRYDLAGNNGKGIPYVAFVAQQISFPTDAVSVGTTQNSNMGGLYGGYYSSNRENYTSIDVTFLDTNLDIFDYLIRPWVIAASYMGLVDDGQLSIKTDMIAKLYTKYDPTEWKLRKEIYFEQVVPTTAPGEVLNYSKDPNLTRQASFIFSKYHVSEGARNDVSTPIIESPIPTIQRSPGLETGPGPLNIGIQVPAGSTPLPTNIPSPTAPTTINSPISLQRLTGSVNPLAIRLPGTL